MADAQSLARLRLWWETVAPETQQMFDKLYRLHPEEVLEVVSGGTVNDLEGAPTMSAALDRSDDGSGPSVFDDMATVPRITIEGPIQVSPVSPSAGQPVTVTWTEGNGGASSEGHLSTAAWWFTDHWGDPVKELVVGPMATGEKAQRSVTLPGAPDGEWAVYVTANADGSVDGTGTITEVGYGHLASVQVLVGGGSRPESPEQADEQNLGNAMMYLEQGIAAGTTSHGLQLIAQGLYAFAGTLDTGGEAARDQSSGRTIQPDAGSIAVVQKAQALEQAASDEGLFDDHSRLRELQKEIEAAYDAVAKTTPGNTASAVDAITSIGSASGIR